MKRTLRDRFAFDSEDARQGGFARVHRGVDLDARPPRDVAVKLLEGTAADEPPLKTFFDREVQSLSALEHPHIVQLIDAGVEEGRYFLVLEWVEADLSVWLSKNPSVTWEALVTDIGVPLAEALAFAHQRSVIHRDIKPANVLMTSVNVPKLADFGIAKIKSDLTLSEHTTVDFVSRPFAPPEQDSTFSRDVFGLGVTLLTALSRQALRDYSDFDRALASIDAAPEIVDLLTRCVSLDIEPRPANGIVLLDELGSILDTRARSRRTVDRVPLGLTKKARSLLERGCALSGRALEEAIARDLADAPTVSSAPSDGPPGTVDERQLYLSGVQWRYRVVVRSPAGRPIQVEIRDVTRFREGQAERARQWELVLNDVSFTFGPVLNHSAARSAVVDVVARLDEWSERRSTQAAERETSRLFDQWRNQLSARQAVEQRRERPIKYSSVRRNGRRATFSLADEAAGVELEEVRRVDTGARGRVVLGVVDDVSDKAITLFFQDEVPTLPEPGRLLVDTSAATIKIDRERAALMAIIHRGRDLVEPTLRSILIDPSSQVDASPGQAPSVWYTPDLDEDKKEAVNIALASSGMFTLEGPPGTGKTTFIAELVAQELQRNPSARILITSQTNVALDHALVGITKAVPAPSVLRLADREGLRVSDEAKGLLVDAQVKKWCGETRVRASEALSRWCDANGVDRTSVEVAARLQELVRARAVAGEAAERRESARSLIEALRLNQAPREEIDDAEVEEQSARESERRARADMRAVEGALEKAARRLGLDLAAASAEDLEKRATDLLDGCAVGAERIALATLWRDRLSRVDEFAEALVTNAHVIGGTCIGVARYRNLRDIEFDLCILDEASKATATEALVPMVRARRWVLVGDQRQLPPFQEEAMRDTALHEEFELDKDELQTTLFDRLLVGLANGSRRSLTTQRRMADAIGDLVSECFYEGRLISSGPEPLSAILGVLPRPVTWWTTSGASGRHERVAGEGSLVNQLEARFVRRLLDRLLMSVQARAIPPTTSVLVLAPYSAQVAELRRVTRGYEERLGSLALEVSTVDAVQGREADLVILSTVRSNPDRKIGFLASDERANVALSRARRGLVLVGDSDFLEQERSPFKKVIGHINTHPADCSIEQCDL